MMNEVTVHVYSEMQQLYVGVGVGVAKFPVAPPPPRPSPPAPSPSGCSPDSPAAQGRSHRSKVTTGVKGHLQPVTEVPNLDLQLSVCII